MPSVFVDDAKEINEENPFESMMERFDEAAISAGSRPEHLQDSSMAEPRVDRLHTGSDG